MSIPHSTSGERHWNAELVAQLEAERVRIRRPSWAPATPEQIRDLIDAVVNSDQEGRRRRRPRNIPAKPRAVS